MHYQNEEESGKRLMKGGETIKNHNKRIKSTRIQASQTLTDTDDVKTKESERMKGHQFYSE